MNYIYRIRAKGETKKGKKFCIERKLEGTSKWESRTLHLPKVWDLVVSVHEIGHNREEITQKEVKKALIGLQKGAQSLLTEPTESDIAKTLFEITK